VAYDSAWVLGLEPVGCRVIAFACQVHLKDLPGKDLLG
jgi:hypothetical protein